MAYRIQKIPMISSLRQGHSLLQVFQMWFLPRDAMLVQYMLSLCLCLFARLSVTSRHCTKRLNFKF